MTVVLTSRDTEVGIEAVKVLQEVGLLVEFHQLDIVDPQSIENFTEWIQETHGGLDILVRLIIFYYSMLYPYVSLYVIY